MKGKTERGRRQAGRRAREGKRAGASAAGRERRR